MIVGRETSPRLGLEPTGDAAFDTILGGGLPARSVIIIAGEPGSGKTVLTHQLLFHAARQGKRCLYLTTLAEPAIKIMRYVQLFEFFDQELLAQQIMMKDLGAMFGKGPQETLRTIEQLVAEHEPAFVAIDSFKALAAFADDAREFRRFLHDLAALLSAFPATCFWVGEYGEDEARTAPEFAVADGIISLATERVNERTLRLIRVAKLRGSDFRSGRHAYRLSASGITVFPRLADPITQSDYRLGDERRSTGIAPLDRMLADGYAPGSSTLVAGPSGVGKTLMGLHFIVDGAASGEPGVIATLQENPIQLQRLARGFGWSLDDERVAVMYRSPNDVYIDEWVYELLDLVERAAAKRVLIDSLSDLQYTTTDAVRFREFIYSLTQRLSRQGVSPIMTSELPDLFHVGRIAEYGISHLSDNVVLLQYLRADTRLRRTVTVLKSRATAHDPDVREFDITRDGIVLAEPTARG
jgi:circadian clock protein KaiC